MRNGSKAGEAVERAMDVLSGPDVRAPKASAGQADRRPYSELPDRSGKWSRPMRALVIVGSAAALWGVIIVGLRAI